ncbi:MAG: RNA methyltransferase [Candidatus Marinimicrobia bacterium]|jgi:tRNA G18 (ribose-2'-O)-methylase SpoU|nr:RNA methyltransferase [Candidatus Neomarinimicrobiota bacterium]MDP6852829.1 RNA methyltransferase [Candidatus Neomarinimicrobiota bacterium]MDP6936081.1 RNA methyltransferase [Candidatus Neomarinimicrobiota bacterium]
MAEIKRPNDELKAARPTLKEIEFIPRLPISILVENVRSVHNVGSIFRSADGFGAEKIYLTGYTAYPPREDLHKTALGSEDAVPWEYVEESIDAAKKIKAAGINLILIEQTRTSIPLYEIKHDFPVCFIVGNEVTGVSEELSKLADVHAELPMRGIKQSLNVSVAAGVVGYELSRAFGIKNEK